jgi:hypothetical protein
MEEAHSATAMASVIIAAEQQQQQQQQQQLPPPIKPKPINQIWLELIVSNFLHPIGNSPIY